MAFGQKEPIISENPALRAKAAPLLEEFNSLKAQSDSLTAQINAGTGDAAANVDSFQTIQANLRRNNDALKQLRSEVGAATDIFDPRLAKQLEEARRQSTGTIDTFATAGTRAANAVKNAQGNGSSAGSTQGDTTTTDGDSRVGTGASGFNGQDDRGTQVGKTNAQDGSGSGDSKDARLNSIGLAAGGVPKNMADVDRSIGVSIRTGFGEGDSSPVGEDWRVRISLAVNSTLFYKNKETGPGIQSPLINTDGVVFPYTPSITVSHTARYGETKLTHSNYGSFFYEGSEVIAINISGEFTVQTEEEGKYVLAAMTFFRSCTKMFFGNQNDQRFVGSPPPMVFLNGYGRLYFPNVPCVITNFSHTMPAEVDYVEVRHTLDEISPYGATKVGGIAKSQIEMLSNAATRVPTSSTMSITIQPVYSRKLVHEGFNLESFASGELLLTRGGFI
jgi:hypothetical protein